MIEFDEEIKKNIPHYFRKVQVYEIENEPFNEAHFKYMRGLTSFKHQTNKYFGYTTVMPTCKIFLSEDYEDL